MTGVQTCALPISYCFTPAKILERAGNHNVPAMFISHKEKSREEFDFEMTSILKNHNVDLLLLIGFMRILSAEFC